jgi:hypothetical protein
MDRPHLSQFATVAEYQAAFAEWSEPVFSTKLATPEQGRNGRWSAAFENWVSWRTGQTYMSSSCTSAPLFDTVSAAEEAGKRALAVLEATGKFPNMCEKF